ncbi:hypothetical protein BVX98_01050 [bacterium F11]|nr:hypothetical protein BVX98_01050 [bacterium F11]
MNRKEELKRQLSSAACLLLGAASVASGGEFEGWDIDTSVLHYQESDGRVSAVEPSVRLRKEFSEKKAVELKLVLDALTGATPNGAAAALTPQTFTTPSGNDTYKAEAGEIPLDPTFRDTRIAVSGNWQQPLGRYSLAVLGANFSKEYDFLSYGANATLSRDLNQRNTTLTLGLSTEFDKITPVGGVPTPFAAMAAPNATQPRIGSEDSKDILDAILGLTQVINRRMLMQFNYSLSRANGYLNDPYKLISRVDGNTGATNDYVYENRPDSRLKNSLYWLTRYHLTRDVISASYRYFTDDWGIKSHTVDLNYHWKMAEKHYLEPRVRFYQQSAADFYRISLISGDPTPQEASADYRLAKFDGITVGLKYGWAFRDESSLMLRLDYYSTMGEQTPESAVGAQRLLNQYPDLGATIFQIQYSF